jgi:pimeloyl-ACP methyl ester carboxylesterase
MDALAADLEARGWHVANLEYRRLGSGGGWPATFDDVAASLRELCDHDPLVAIGHSAGGHLALWAAAEGLVTHAVGQAPVSDLAEAARLGLSNGAALELVDGRTELFARLSPFERLPLGVPQLLVHGEDDDIVPAAISRAYVEASGGEAELVLLPGVGHFEHLDPASAAWQAVLEWLP